MTEDIKDFIDEIETSLENIDSAISDVTTKIVDEVDECVDEVRDYIDEIWDRINEIKRTDDDDEVYDLAESLGSEVEEKYGFDDSSISEKAEKVYDAINEADISELQKSDLELEIDEVESALHDLSNVFRTII